MPAHDIPLLPGDPAVLAGLMPNGMKYYLVANPGEKGVADFALVQKTGVLSSCREDSAKVVAAADGALSSLRRAVNPDLRCDIKVTDDATMFRFADVKLNSNPPDSLLLVLMDIADRTHYTGDEFIREWYSPADQAVIISGDIDTKAMASKLTYMSYMIPAKVSRPRTEYASGEDKNTFDVTEWHGLAKVSATWTSKKVPREYMNTVQPEIFEMSINTLGTAAVSRIRTCLRSMDIPVADVSFSYISGSTYPYDDSFSIHLAVEREDAGRAQDVISAVMSSIDVSGLMEKEYLMAESPYMLALAEESAIPVKSNHEYVDRCVNAFLYNASLASPKERLAFHKSRNLPDTMRQRLFNGIASAVIDTEWGLVPEVPKAHYVEMAVPDTLAKAVPPVKIKVKSSKKEPVSGGVIWTFSNGFKVVYKQMASDRMYYRLALNGGYGSIEGLESGEGAFIGDYLLTSRIGHVKIGDYMEILRKDGVTMDVAVNLSNMMISGSLPKEKMPLLLRSLLAVANERTSADEKDVDYYKRSEYLSMDYARGDFYSRMTAIDSIMCPGYAYSPYKVKEKISDDFISKAESYYDARFGKTDEGVLILAGNMNEESLKKQLLEYVGHFRTANTVSRKPSLRYQAVSGSSTYIVRGDSDNVDVAISVRMPLSIDNYAAADVALMILRDNLIRKFNESGLDVTFSQNCRIYPEERINLMISIPSASLEDLAAIRSALAGMKDIEIPDTEMKACKDIVKNNMALTTKAPSYWVHAMTLRYLDGKDLSTNYAAKVDAVTAEKIREILGLLDDGTKVEYVTIKE